MRLDLPPVGRTSSYERAGLIINPLSGVGLMASGAGGLYLVAVMDWASRKVLAWRLSNTLDSSFCVEALHEALDR